MENQKYFYYRLFDDKEEKNYFKCNLDLAEITKRVKEYEKDHEEYLNADFVNFIKEQGAEAELIELRNIYY
jgi:hypothetical protein